MTICSNEAGETTAAIHNRMADGAWPMIEKQLRDGAVLQKVTGLRDYYTHGAGPAFFQRCLPAARVRKLAAEGILIRVGVDMYGLAEAAK